MWKFFVKINNHYYWHHSEGYYNCTSENTPPDAESGYYNLGYLMTVKNDEEFFINGYKISYNGFWHRWQMSHDKIGHVGNYINLEDAIRDAKKG